MDEIDKRFNHTSNDVPEPVFRHEPPLKLKELSAALCNPDVQDSSTMLMIEEHPKGDSRYCIFVDVIEAYALRDWLNKVLP